MERSIVSTFEPRTPEGVAFEDRGDRVRLTAERDLDGVAGAGFATVAIGADFRVEHPAPGVAYLGFAFTQFAMPVTGGPDRPFVWNPTPNLHSPPVVVPLVVRNEAGQVALLAPLDGWHEQVFAVDQDSDGIRGFRWGWHGDLDRIPAGTTATLGIYGASSVSAAFARWQDDVAEAVGRPGGGLPPRPRDPVTERLSYWTDNGAAYWYRTEPGRDLPTTLADKMVELDDLGVAVGSVELDSWFYPHEVSRPVADVGYLEEVPPTGLLRWTPRPDVLPDGVADLARRMGGRPLVLHARHISPESPYLAEGEWWSDFAAHPVDPAFFERWAADAAAWGATCIEQDWMLMVWFGVGPLRAEPGRALEWQRALDRAAASHGLTLLWCMATPGDLLATVELERICAVRTSDDYRYADDPALLWRWYLTVNRLAAALELPVSKDCFFTARRPEAQPESTSEADLETNRPSLDLDGDPHPEVEAVLSALSAGVVGIGDRLGRTDPALVARLCRPDGVLVQPDAPLALADRSFFDTPADPVPTWAETFTDAGPAGAATGRRWRYLVALHAADTDDPVAGSFLLDGPVLIYDWRAGTAEVGDRVEVELARRDWALFVCCPLGGGTPTGAGSERPVPIGDPAMVATMGSARITIDDELTVRPVLAPGEDELTVRFWSAERGIHDVHLS